MNNKLLASSLLGALAALALHIGTAHAAPEKLVNGDPARWYQADDSPKARLRNLNQETTAAYGQALQDCKALRGKEARACRQQAGAARKDDAARAQRIYQDYKAAAAKSGR
ncbi:hypothetical protein [uncultured Herbaspirillum sp.]|uniref:hypothetical protein n=1 Tax=uncultured Herbaspirillum sp. TaxID=160236 RepID=UPI00258649C8|nr:hypothetical protein [uncultured Herbaspirillum sp.]